MNRFFHISILTDNPNAPAEPARDTAIGWKKVIMNKVCWIMIFAYSLMMVKPVVPIFADAMAHTFWETEHMKVHEEFGKFHVHYEVMKASNQSDKDNSSGNCKSITADELYVNTMLVYNIPVTHIVHSKVYSCYNCCYATSYAGVNYPPPKASATI